MKKVLCVLLALVLFVCLYNALLRDRHFECLQSADRIARITLYDLGAEGVEYTIDDSAVPLVSLEPAQFAAFVSELEALPMEEPFLIPGGDPFYAMYGYAARITYADGAVEYISNGVQTCFRANGLRGSSECSCAEEIWIAFLEPYLP